MDYVTNNPGCGSIDVAQHFGCSVSDINRSRAGYSGIYKLRALIHMDYLHYPKTEDARWTTTTLQNVFARPVVEARAVEQQTLERVTESLKLREQMCAKLTEANALLTQKCDLLTKNYDSLAKKYDDFIVLVEERDATIEEREALRQQHDALDRQERDELVKERDAHIHHIRLLVRQQQEREIQQQEREIQQQERELPTTSDVRPKIKARVRRPAPEVPQCAVCLENFDQEWKLQNRRRCCSAKFCHACERRTIGGPCPVCRNNDRL